MPKPIVVEEMIQKLKEQLNTGLSLSPEFVSEFFVNNIVSRCLTYLMGWDEFSGEPKKVKVTPDGMLKVSTTPIGYTINETYIVEVSAGSYSLVEFEDIVGTIDIFNDNIDILFERSVDGVLWQSPIYLPANVTYSFDCKTKAIRLKAKNPGESGVIQVVGWR